MLLRIGGKFTTTDITLESGCNATTALIFFFDEGISFTSGLDISECASVT